MALIQTVHLSMANFKSAPVVPAVQNDTDRQIKMVIDDFDLTAGLTGKITFVRSDGTHYEASATLDTATNSFTADIDQALTQPGRTMVQLKVTDTLTVSTFSFVIFVEEDTSGTVTPQEGIDLVTAVEAAEDAAERAEQAAQSGMSESVKTALLACFEHVAWIGDDGQDYYDSLYNALYPPAELVSITATFTQGENTIWSDDTLDSLKQYLVVVANYSDGQSTTISSTDYILSGTLSTASSTITATYQDKTDTFTVTVTLVGSTNYASTSMSNLTRTTQAGATGITDGVLWMKCLNASQISGYNIWAFDCKPTLFSTLQDKVVRVRIRAKSPDWSGDLSDTNRVKFWVTVYQNANVKSGGGRQDNISLGGIAPTSEYKTYEYVTTVSSSASSITSASTVGLCVYHQSLHTVQIASIEIVEVLS